MTAPLTSRILALQLRAGDAHARRLVAATLRRCGTIAAAARELGCGRRLLERAIVACPALDTRANAAR